MARKTKKPVVTKKHLARLERERRQTRAIILTSVLVVAAVVLLIGYGILQQTVLTPRKTLVKIGSDRIILKDFQERVRYQREQLISQYQQVLQFAQYFGSSAGSYFDTQLQNIQTQLDTPNAVGQQVLDQMINEILVRHEADNLGITVSDQEIEQRVQSEFGYFPNGTPTVQPTLPEVPTPTLNPTQKALFPPTATPTASPTPTQTATASPTFTPTATLAGTPTPTLTPEPTLTPTPYTQDAFQQNYQNFIDTYQSQVGVPESIIRSVIENQIYQEKVMDVVLADLKPEEEQVWARHILVADQATAQKVEDLLKAGGDFATLAKEYSTDSTATNGGDLGWFGKGVMDPAFEQVAFSLAIGQISDPVQTQFGWHIIQVLGHEVRPLDQSQFDQLRQQKFSDWLTQQRDAEQVDINSDWTNYVPAEPTLPPATQG